MRRGVLEVILAVGLLLISFARVATAGTPGKLSCDLVEFDAAANTMTAKGNVEVTHGDVRVQADEVRVNTRTGELLALGNVRVTQEGEEASGDRFTYNLKTGEGELVPGRAVIRGEEISGELYVTGREFHGSPGKIRVVGGSLTSCDLDVPHYHIAAGEIEVDIDKRIVLRNVVYYEGKFPLFYWPYFVISLHEENAFTLPRVGYSREGGWFIKTAYNYYRNPDFRGLAYLDYFENWGLGLGLKHFYDAGSFGTGYAYAYRVGSLDRGYSRTTLELSHDLDIGEVAAHLVLGQEDTLDGSEHTISRYGDLSLDARAWRFYIKGTRQDGATGGDEIKAGGDLRMLIPGGPAISVSSEYCNAYFTDWGREGYWNYRAQAHETLGPIDAEVNFERFTKPRKRDEDEIGDEEGAEEIPWNALNRLPEVSLKSHVFRIGELPFDLRASLLWGKYQEMGVHYDGPDLLTGDRVEMAVDAALPTLRSKGSGATLTAGGGIVLGSYTTGDSRAVVKSEAGVAMPLASGLSFKLDYSYAGIWGRTPFLFDEIDPSEELGAKIALWRGKVEAELGSGYDFMSRAPLDLEGKLCVRLDDRRSIEGTIRMDPGSFAPREATARITLTPNENMSLKFGARYDFESSSLMRLESEANLKLPHNWNASWTAVYGGTVPKIQRIDVGITRDLHCRELKLMYSYKTGEVWLEYRIKAFPFEGLKFGLGKEGVLFETPSK